MPRRAAVALAVVGLTLALVVPAQAVERTGKRAPKILTPTTTALTIAQAIASSSVTVTGASFVTKPPNGQPNGVGDASPALGGFPLDGGTYGILTTGNLASVDKPGTFANTNDGGAAVRGDTSEDVTILKIDLTIPQAVNCLSFNFRFLSEEYPTFVGTSFNDAFIAELDTSDWTTSGSTITAPHNFAFDSTSHVVSINSTGLGGMSAANGAGTAFDGTGSDSKGGATVLLGAATPITPGAHSLYLSIFDQGDQYYDSAVFLDNLREGSVPTPADCKVGATQPAHLTLAKTVVNTGGGTAAATDWTLSATGPTTVSGATGSAAVTNAVVNPGTYTLGEGGPANYSAGAWSCTGGSLTGSSLVLAAGDNASCSITNTFVPPSAVPSSEPSVVPSTAPSTAPSEVPSTAPSAVPSNTPSPEPTAAHTPHHTPVVTLPPTSTVGDGSSTDGGSGLWLAGILAITSVIGFALAPRPRRRKG